MIRNLTILVVVLMVTCVAARAQAPSPTPKNAEEVSTGGISGKVVNENGQPMVGANVFVRSFNSAQGRRTSTDLEGTFRVNGLDPGLYTIVANAPAYTTVPAPEGELALPSYYRLGDSVRLEMVRGGVITGVVTNAQGEPVIGVRVRVSGIRDAKGQKSKAPPFAMNEQMTDDRGIYRIYGLPPGTYIVSAGGGAGNVFNSLFNPYDSDIPTYAPSSTRDNAAEVSVRPGEESTADIRYKGEAGYTISGTVKTANGSGAQISLTSAGSGVFVGNMFQFPGSRGFAFSGLADGEYKLVGHEFTMMQSKMPQLGTSDVKRITVKGANVTGIELIPKPLSSVSGRILLERTKAQACEGKRPPLFAETLVLIQRHEKDSESEGVEYLRMRATFVAVDDNGAFVMRGLPPGRFRFEPRFHARYWFLQSITTSSAGPKPQKTDVAANWTTLKSGDQISNIMITLAEGAASIRGSVALAEGATAPAGMVVYLVPAEPDKAEDVLRFFVTEVASDGVFTLNNLPPGKYLSFTQINPDAQIATLTKLRQPEAALARTKLRASAAQKAEAQKNEIELKPCQNLADYQLKQ